MVDSRWSMVEYFRQKYPLVAHRQIFQNPPHFIPVLLVKRERLETHRIQMRVMAAAPEA